MRSLAYLTCVNKSPESRSRQRSTYRAKTRNILSHDASRAKVQKIESSKLLVSFKPHPILDHSLLNDLEDEQSNKSDDKNSKLEKKDVGEESPEEDKRKNRKRQHSKHNKKTKILLLNKSLTNFIKRNKEVKCNSVNKLIAFREKNKLNQSDNEVHKNAFKKKHSCLDNLKDRFSKSITPRNAITQRGKRIKLNVKVENQIKEEKIKQIQHFVNANRVKSPEERRNRLLSPRDRLLKPSFQINFSKFVEERRSKANELRKDQQKNEDELRCMNYSDVMVSMRYLESHRPMIESVKIRRYLNNKTLRKIYSKIVVT